MQVTKTRALLGVLILWFLIRRAYRAKQRLESALSRVSRPKDEETDTPDARVTLIASTSKGDVRGFLARSPKSSPFIRPDVELANFRGIPFAQPPTGVKGRFKHPRPALGWAPKVWDATRFGPRSVSNPDFGVEVVLLTRPRLIASFIFRILFGWGFNTDPTDPKPLNPLQSEDCLYLSVCVPSETLATKKKKLPVAVWFHGGAFTMGASSEPLYQHPWGNALALRDVCVVSVNYRLGVLGYVKVEGGDYNCGLMDQIESLKWVKEEIANFGGDPDNVTIFGQSAGGMSVGALLASPKAKGLFRRAVPMSGAACNAFTKEDSLKVTKMLSRALGLKSDIPTKAELEDLSPDALFAAQTYIQVRGRMGPMPIQPVIDGEILPDFPQTCIQNGSARDIDLMVGTTKEEVNLFRRLAKGFPVQQWTAVRVLASFLGPEMLGLARNDQGAKTLAERLVHRYVDHEKKEMGGDRADFDTVMCRVATDIIFEVPCTLLVEAHVDTKSPGVKTYRYRFDVQGSTKDLGAAHGLDIPYIMGTISKWNENPIMRTFVGRVDDEAHLRVANQMAEAWVRFFYTGNPNHPDLSAEWQEFTHERGQTYLFDLGAKSRLRTTERARTKSRGTSVSTILNELESEHELEDDEEAHRRMLEEEGGARDDHQGFDFLVRKRSMSGRSFGLIT